MVLQIVTFPKSVLRPSWHVLVRNGGRFCVNLVLLYFYLMSHIYFMLSRCGLWSQSIFLLNIFQCIGGCENKPRVIPVLFTLMCASNDFDLIKYDHGVQLSSGFLTEDRLRAFFRSFLLSQAPPFEAIIRGISQDHFGKQTVCFSRSFIDTST